MKKIMILGAALLFVVAAKAQVNSHNINVVDFHSISCNSNYTVYVKQSNKEEVRVEALREIYEISEFIVKEGVLHINIEKKETKANKSIWAKIDDIKLMPTLKVYVSIKDVKALHLNGGGKIITENSIASDELDILLAGTGSMELDVKGKNVMAKLAGPGNLELSGYADQLNVEQSGSGDLSAFNFEVSEAQMNLYGLGNAELNVSDKLNATIFGSGTVKVKGATKSLEKKEFGSGEVSRAY